MKTTLDRIPPGQRATIIAIEPEIRDRLEDLGFLPGETLRVQNRAVGGGPLAVRVGGAVWALNCDEARRITVVAQGLILLENQAES